VSGQALPPLLKRCTAFPVAEIIVTACLDTEVARDQLFARGWRSGLGDLTRRERAAIAGVTGHVAESVIEVLLEPLGWLPLWHLTGPGRHGVDLVLLAPGDVVVAIEVKGTLVPGRVPRLSTGELKQMSAAWVDKVDNPGMAELGLASADVYGGVAVVNLADLTWRAALTRDFVIFEPISTQEQLADLGWLVRVSAEGMEREHGVG
jgi:hypothetical protein